MSSRFILLLCGAQHHETENSAYKKALAEATQRFEKKIAELTKQLEDKNAHVEVIEEQLHSAKSCLSNHQNSMQVNLFIRYIRKLVNCVI